MVDVISAAEARARLIRAARLHEARILAGHDDDESVEAEAGAILEAETQDEIHKLYQIASAWMEANRK